MTAITIFSCLLLAFVPGRASAADLASHTPLGAAGNGRSTEPVMSADGRFVAFTTLATNLVSGVADGNGASDVVVQDRQTGALQVVSAIPSGAQTGNGASSGPLISGDGRFIAFVSSATDLVAGVVDTNDDLDLFIRDRVTGITQLVSRNASGLGTGNSASDAVMSMTPDGRFLVFRSRASDLAPGVLDINLTADLFVRDRVAGSTRLVSATPSGVTTGNAASGGAAVSADGRFIAFESDASDLVASPADTGSKNDVFVRDRVAGTTQIVSVDPTGLVVGDDDSNRPALSADGRFVAFLSRATNLTPGFTDVPGTFDVFVRDRQTGITQLVTVNAAGTAAGAGTTDSFAMSPDGRFIALASDAGDLVAGALDVNASLDVFVRDRVLGTTDLVSRRTTGLITGNGGSFLPVLSDDGRFVAFMSAAADLVATDANAADDVYLRDRSAGTTKLVSLNALRSGSGNGASTLPSITADGGVLLFQSLATNLASGASDTNQGADILTQQTATIALPVSPTGDVNGDGKVNVQDVTLILRLAVGDASLPLTPEQKARGDLNSSGVVDVGDAILALKIALNIAP